MASVTVLDVDIPCPECYDKPDDQPNHCRKCGGAGSFRRRLATSELHRLPGIPIVRAAILVFREPGPEILTAAELGIVVQIAAGWRPFVIAALRRISLNTVESHQRNIYRKLGIDNRADLIRWASRHKIGGAK